MSQHPGITFTSPDIATEFKVSKDQAAKSLSYLRSRGHIESPISGGYLYRKAPPGKAKPEHAVMWEFIGMLADGRPVAKGDDDGIYVMERL